ncbi:MAG: hypothetical protein QOK28_3385 [Actinomycetota bacterium]|jgi:hypothetical protein
MRLHRFSAGTGSVITHPEAPPDQPIGQLLDIEDGESAYVVGSDIALDINLTLAQLFPGDVGHLVTHRCRDAKITAVYAGHRARLDVHVATLVSGVLDQAVHDLKIDAATAADLVIRLHGSTEDMVLTNPIGAYLDKRNCQLAVDLVHVVRPQG